MGHDEPAAGSVGDGGKGAQEVALLVGLVGRDRQVVRVERLRLRWSHGRRARVRGGAVEPRERDVLLFRGHAWTSKNDEFGRPISGRSQMITSRGYWGMVLLG